MTLDGREVVKVSLATGDRRLAVTRWEELHPIVQGAVREAERRQAAANAAERDRVAPERLAPEAVRTMAAQVLHKVLAEHDQTYIDPDHLNGTAQAIAQATSSDGRGGPDPADLRAAERVLRERWYQSALIDRQLGRLDVAVTEGEVDLPPELAERPSVCPTTM